MNQNPEGEERKYQQIRGVNVDGAPITYIITLAAVAATLGLIPLSIVIGSGKSFPMSQGIYPLIGWLLGPVAGAIANATGAIIGLIIAPYTSVVPVASVTGAIIGGLIAGSMTLASKRRIWWIPLAVLMIVLYLAYAGRAVILNSVPVLSVIAGSLIDWSALILFISPLRNLVPRWIGSGNIKQLPLGLFLGTWIAAGLTHLTSSTIIYYILNWPEAVWLTSAPVAPIEHLVRCLVGTLIGTGLIVGLRAIGLVKAHHAIY